MHDDRDTEGEQPGNERSDDVVDAEADDTEGGGANNTDASEHGDAGGAR